MENYYFFEDNNFGFGKGYFIIFVLLSICDDILKVLNWSECILFVLVDFFKVFDIVKYRFVFEKMNVFGFLKLYFKWIVNYLCGRE